MEMLTDKEIREIQEALAHESAEVQTLCSILGDANRFKIVRLLRVYEELCVTDFAKILKISMSAVSQHLRLLELSNVVVSERMGQVICYMLRKDNLALNTLLDALKITRLN